MDIDESIFAGYFANRKALKKGEEVMSTGTSALRQLVLDQVSLLSLCGDRIALMSSWDEVSTHLLRLCLRKKLLDEGEVRVEIYKRLLDIGHRCYKQHMQTKTYPDHTTSPHAFAFAIHNDVFSRVELESIEFDHGDTLETFMAGEISDLPEKIFNQLVAWKKPEPSGEAGFPACC